MLITVLSGVLQKHIALATHALSTRTQLPILGSFLLHADTTGLTLTATDLELGIQTSVGCTVEEAGDIAVPAKTFSELFAQIPEGKVTLRTEGQTLSITGEHIKSKLQVTSPDEFPDIFEDSLHEFLTLMPSEVDRIVKDTLFATSSEVTRPIWSGVLCERKENEIRFVASDGFRLSLVSIPQEKTDEEQKGIVFSSRFLKEVTLLKEDKPIHFFFSDQVNQIVAQQEHIRIAGRKIEGEFPSYGKIIPHETSSQIRIKKEELLRAVRLCAAVAKDASSVIVLDLTKDGLRVSAQTASVGESTVGVEGMLKGEENAIAFNPRFLLDILGALSTEEILFEMTAPLSPGVFKNVGDDSFLHIIMPVRV